MELKNDVTGYYYDQVLVQEVEKGFRYLRTNRVQDALVDTLSVETEWKPRFNDAQGNPIPLKYSIHQVTGVGVSHYFKLYSRSLKTLALLLHTLPKRPKFSDNVTTEHIWNTINACSPRWGYDKTIEFLKERGVNSNTNTKEW